MARYTLTEDQREEVEAALRQRKDWLDKTKKRDEEGYLPVGHVTSRLALYEQIGDEPGLLAVFGPMLQTDAFVDPRKRQTDAFDTGGAHNVETGGGGTPRRAKGRAYPAGDGLGDTANEAGEALVPTHLRLAGGGEATEDAPAEADWTRLPTEGETVLMRDGTVVQIAETPGHGDDVRGEGRIFRTFYYTPESTAEAPDTKRALVAWSDAEERWEEWAEDAAALTDLIYDVGVVARGEPLEELRAAAEQWTRLEIAEAWLWACAINDHQGGDPAAPPVPIPAAPAHVAPFVDVGRAPGVAAADVDAAEAGAAT